MTFAVKKQLSRIDRGNDALAEGKDQCWGGLTICATVEKIFLIRSTAPDDCELGSITVAARAQPEISEEAL